MMMKNLHWKPVLTALPNTIQRGIDSVIYKINRYLKLAAGLEVGNEDEQVAQEPSTQQDGDLGKDAKDARLQALKGVVEMAEDYIQTTRKENQELREEENCPNYWTIQGINIALEYLEYLHLEQMVFEKGRFFMHTLKKEKKSKFDIEWANSV